MLESMLETLLELQCKTQCNRINSTGIMSHFVYILTSVIILIKNFAGIINEFVQI